MIREQAFHLGPAIQGAPRALTLAWQDLIQGLKAFPIWGMLGWQDIRQRYRRSVLGPFWLTISTAIMVGALSIVYSGLFKQSLSDYLPFIGTGLIIWTLISSIFNESCHVFTSAEGMIKQLRLPLTLHVCRMVWRNVIIFGHNAAILLLIYMFFGKGWHADLLTLPLALLMLAINGVTVGLILGVFCTRFRDIVQIVANMIQLLFFVTPIMWNPDALADRGWIAHFNPAYHFIELMRAPILGAAFPVVSWQVAASITALGLIVALLVLTRFRHRVAYWL